MNAINITCLLNILILSHIQVMINLKTFFQFNILYLHKYQSYLN